MHKEKVAIKMLALKETSHIIDTICATVPVYTARVKKWDGEDCA